MINCSAWEVSKLTVIFYLKLWEVIRSAQSMFRNCIFFCFQNSIEGQSLFSYGTVKNLTALPMNKQFWHFSIISICLASTMKRVTILFKTFSQSSSFFRLVFICGCLKDFAEIDRPNCVFCVFRADFLRSSFLLFFFWSFMLDLWTFSQIGLVMKFCKFCKCY